MDEEDPLLPTDPVDPTLVSPRGVAPNETPCASAYSAMMLYKKERIYNTIYLGLRFEEMPHINKTLKYLMSESTRLGVCL